MGRPKDRLSPEEVKQILQKQADEARRKDEDAAPFHNPFAAAAEKLARIVPAKPTAAQRRRTREAKPTPEPTILSAARAKKRAEREALTAAVQPIRRAGARPASVAPEAQREPPPPAARAVERDDLAVAEEPPADRRPRPEELFPHPPRRR